MNDPRCIDLDAERAVLGIILTDDASWLAYIEAGLTAECFYRTAHRIIYEACREIVSSTGLPPGHQILRALDAAGTLEAAGGPVYISELLDYCRGLSLRDFVPQVRHLQRLTRSRALGSMARVLADECEQSYGGLDDDACAAHIEAMDGACRSASSVRVLDAQQQVEVTMLAQHEMAQGRSARFGIPAIDLIVDGIRPGRTYGIFARTSVGKTTVGCHVAVAHGKDQKGMLFFSLEMEAYEVVGRLARMGLRESMAHKHITPHADAYIQHYSTVGICDTPGLTMAQVEQLIRSEQRHRPISTVVIDYLGLMRSADPRANEYERMSEIPKEMKEVAKRTHVGIVTLVQIARGQGGDGSEEVGLGQGRGSGVIEETLDVGIGLRWLGACRAFDDAQRAQWYNAIWARVFKNRHGRTSSRDTALVRDLHTTALTPDEDLLFPEDAYRQATKAASKGGGY